MEKALNISFTDQLDLFNAEYDRIYFGNEFCPELIPAVDDLEKVLDFAHEHYVKVSLTTPFATDPHLIGIQKLLDRLMESYPDGEVVFNDWGVFKEIKSRGLVPILGRLLVSQLKDPRLVEICKGISRELIRQFRMPALNNNDFDFFRSQGIGRIEFDPAPQMIWLPIGYYTEGINYSLHLPYAYVATSRYCLWSGNPERPDRVLGVFECSHACREEPICSLSLPEIDKPLFIRGNTIFVKLDRAPEDPAGMKIDRMIISPEIPI